MGKSFGKLNIIYLAGMILIVVGFILPMFSGFGFSLNGFDFINLDNFGTTTIAALFIIIGGVAGIVFCFFNIGNSDMMKLIAVLVSIAGGVILLVAANDSWLTKTIGRGFWKQATTGTYMVLAGWIVGLVGWYKK